MTQNSHLMAKLQTMLEIASRETTTPGEAAAAMSKAQELMLKHDIAESQVRAFEKTPAAIKIERGEIYLGWGLYKAWKQKVIFETAKYFMLRGFGGGPYFGIVLGRHKDIQVYKAVLQSLFAQIDAQAAKALKNRTPEEKDRVHGKTFKRAFYKGAAVGIIDCMAEEQRQRHAAQTATAAHQNAITLVIDGAITNYIQEEWGGLLGTYRNNEGRGDRGAYLSGYRTGRDISAMPALGDGHTNVN